MAIGRPSEMNLKEEARRAILARKQQSYVNSQQQSDGKSNKSTKKPGKEPAGETNKSTKKSGGANNAEAGGAPGQQGATRDWIGVQGLNFNQPYDAHRNVFGNVGLKTFEERLKELRDLGLQRENKIKEQLKSPLGRALLLSGIGNDAGQGYQTPYNVNTPTFNPEKYTGGINLPEGMDRREFTPSPITREAIQKEEKGLSEATNAFKEEYEKGPEKVKDILDLKGVGILAGGALLAKLLGVDDGYIAEFVQGFLPTVQKEQERREEKAQKEHQQKLAALRSLIEARSSALASLTNVLNTNTNVFRANVWAENIAFGANLNLAMAAKEKGELAFNVDKTNQLIRYGNADRIRQSRQELMQMLQSITPEALPDLVEQYNTLAVAESQITGVPVPLITTEMAASWSKLLEMKGRTLELQDSQTQAQFTMALHQNILNFITQMRNWVFAPGQKDAKQMILASATFLGEFIASIDFPGENDDETRMKLLQTWAPFINTIWNTPTQAERAFQLQEKALSVEEFYKRAYISWMGKRLKYEQNIALLGMMVEAASQGEKVAAQMRNQIIQQVILPAISDLLETGLTFVPTVDAIINNPDLSDEEKISRLLREKDMIVTSIEQAKTISAEKKEVLKAQAQQLAGALLAVQAGYNFATILPGLVGGDTSVGGLFFGNGQGGAGGGLPFGNGQGGAGGGQQQGQQ